LNKRDAYAGPVGQRDQRELGGAWTTFQTHSFAAPAPDLSPFIARYWMVQWDVGGQPPYRQLVVPYPQAHLTWINDEPPRLHGVVRGHQFRTLAGVGRVFGIAFRPGGLRPFLDRPMSTITGRTVAPDAVLGPDPCPLAAGAEDALVRRVEALVRPHRPAPDPAVEAVAGIVALIEAQPIITRVEALAQWLGIPVRATQRLFAEYIGVPPKWVIRRYRLRAVTERLAAGDTVHWGQLAAELGYADQAHLTRDFRAMFGESPGHYARRYP
jgi:AraC-like DNA-binding protein